MESGAATTGSRVDAIQARAILLVEDDHDIRQAVALVLRGEGYRVYEAENGQAGLDLLARIPRPCVILLDMMMPVLDGYGFLRLLETHEALVSIPVIVVSAATQAADTTKTFLRKPFDLEALVTVIKKHCGI